MHNYLFEMYVPYTLIKNINILTPLPSNVFLTHDNILFPFTTEIQQSNLFQMDKKSCLTFLLIHKR